MADQHQPQLCSRCGQRHWTIYTCDGQKTSVVAARRRQQGPVLIEPVDSPPLPWGKSSEGTRPFGNRLDNFQLAGNTLLLPVKKKEPSEAA